MSEGGANPNPLREIWEDLRKSKHAIVEARNQIGEIVQALPAGPNYMYELALAQAALDTAFVHLARARQEMAEQAREET